MNNTKIFIGHVLHVIVQGMVWVLPILIAQHPEWQTMTVSGALSLAVMFAAKQIGNQSAN